MLMIIQYKGFFDHFSLDEQSANEIFYMFASKLFYALMNEKSNLERKILIEKNLLNIANNSHKTLRGE